jgi:hypothetical protein
MSLYALHIRAMTEERKKKEWGSKEGLKKRKWRKMDPCIAGNRRLKPARQFVEARCLHIDGFDCEAIGFIVTG